MNLREKNYWFLRNAFAKDFSTYALKGEEGSNNTKISMTSFEANEYLLNRKIVDQHLHVAMQLFNYLNDFLVRHAVLVQNFWMDHASFVAHEVRAPEEKNTRV